MVQIMCYRCNKKIQKNEKYFGIVLKKVKSDNNNDEFVFDSRNTIILCEDCYTKAENNQVCFICHTLIKKHTKHLSIEHYIAHQTKNNKEKIQQSTIAKICNQCVNINKKINKTKNRFEIEVLPHNAKEFSSKDAILIINNPNNKSLLNKIAKLIIKIASKVGQMKITPNINFINFEIKY